MTYWYIGLAVAGITMTAWVAAQVAHDLPLPASEWDGNRLPPWWLVAGFASLLAMPGWPLVVLGGLGYVIGSHVKRKRLTAAQNSEYLDAAQREVDEIAP